MWLCRSLAAGSRLVPSYLCESPKVHCSHVSRQGFPSVIKRQYQRMLDVGEAAMATLVLARAPLVPSTSNYPKYRSDSCQGNQLVQGGY